MQALSLELPVRVRRLPSVFTANPWAMPRSTGITLELVRNRLSLTSVLRNQNLQCSSPLGSAWTGGRLRSLDSNSVSFGAFLGSLDQFRGSNRSTEPGSVLQHPHLPGTPFPLEASVAPHCLEGQI